MSKSNPVHPWRLGRTRALIFTQKSLNRAKTGVPHGTPKKIPRLGRDVSTMRKTQSTKINRKINSIVWFGHTRALRKKKKKWHETAIFPALQKLTHMYYIQYSKRPKDHSSSDIATLYSNHLHIILRQIAVDFKCYVMLGYFRGMMVRLVRQALAMALLLLLLLLFHIFLLPHK